MLSFLNTGDVDQVIKHGERLAQMILLPYIHYNIVETNVLNETERGIGGFGSTGK
jgi:dUTP pyrophosphatase